MRSPKHSRAAGPGNRTGSPGPRYRQSGKGVFEDNDLTGNKRGAWEIAAYSKDNVAHVPVTLNKT